MNRIELIDLIKQLNSANCLHCKYLKSIHKVHLFNGVCEVTGNLIDLTGYCLNFENYDSE